MRSLQLKAGLINGLIDYGIDSKLDKWLYGEDVIETYRDLDASDQKGYRLKHRKGLFK